ncbi:MAG: acetate--CoA ligase family protein [Tardiphaga sp.]|nr:acetate--CoA ligase family protein [Tardiphaga sp.]
MTIADFATSTARVIPYRRDQLRRLIAPRSVAIIGASDRKSSFGNRAMENLQDFDGPVHLVNARATSVAGRPCFASVAAIGEAPDCVFIAVPREMVESVVRECAAAGVGGAVIVASGLAETAKPDRIADQQRIVEIARRADMRLVGPNTIGFLNYGVGAALTFSAMPARRALLPHAIGIISQSGSLGFSLAQAAELGVSISHVLTAGNSADVDVADYVAYLAEEPACKAIICVFEGMAHPVRMGHALRFAWSVNKPVIMYKMATGNEGARAAMSHTGSLAGSNEAYAAMFARAGVIQVDRFEDLIETATFFAKAPRPTTDGVAVIATSGGATIMAADKAEWHGIPLPQPGTRAADLLAIHVPDFGSPRNPCDVTAQLMNDMVALESCVDALMADAQFGAMVTSHAYAYDSATSRLPVFSRAAASHGKIVCNVWAPAWLGGPGTIETQQDGHLALFNGMDRCFATLAAWQRRERLRQTASDAPPVRLTAAHAAAQVTEILRGITDTALTESQSKRVAALYGIPVVAEAVVGSANEAVVAAGRLGYPVVLKIESPDILHKTEAGVVCLNLPDAQSVRDAAIRLLELANAIVPAPRINGLLVQPMIPKGVEVMVGVRNDPQFGPLVMVGLGGILVELLKDVAIAIAPVSTAEARRMILGLKGATLLTGFRGRAAIDINALAGIVARVSELADDHRAAIAEIDFNPLICDADRIIAVDALIVKIQAG